MLSNLILLTCLNRYLLVLCYTIVIFSLNHLNLNSVPELVAPFRSLSLSKGPNHCLFVSALHSKPTLFAAFLLNHDVFSLNRLTDSPTHRLTVSPSILGALIFLLRLGIINAGHLNIFGCGSA